MEIENTNQEEAVTEESVAPEVDLVQSHINEVQTKDGEDDGSQSQGEEGVNAGEGEGSQDPKGPAEPQKTGEPPKEAQGEAVKEEGGTPGAEAYTPDLSFKYLREKHEMPEELKGVIKTKEQEEYYRDLFVKAKGFPFVQEKRKEAETQLNQVFQNLDQFYQHANMGDYQKAWEMAELPKPTIEQAMRGFGFTPRELIQHAYDLANKTPEQMQATDLQIQMERRNRELEMRMQNMESSSQRQLEQQIYGELEELKVDPEIGPIVEAFDQKEGAGAFFQEIASRGEQINRLENRIARPRELAKQIIGRYNLNQMISQPTGQKINQSPVSQSAPGNQAQGQPARSNKRQEIPVIPNVESAGGSPGERAITSLDDIKKIYDEKYGSAATF